MQISTDSRCAKGGPSTADTWVTLYGSPCPILLCKILLLFACWINIDIDIYIKQIDLLTAGTKDEMHLNICIVKSLIEAHQNGLSVDFERHIYMYMY